MAPLQCSSAVIVQALHEVVHGRARIALRRRCAFRIGSLKAPGIGDGDRLVRVELCVKPYALSGVILQR